MIYRRTLLSIFSSLPVLAVADNYRTSSFHVVGSDNHKELLASSPLTKPDLNNSVIGNSIIGKTCRSESMYELYFSTDGTLLFRKNCDNNYLYEGRWGIEGQIITSIWPRYSNNLNKLEYYRLAENTYIPFNINCACGPEGTFGHPFLIFEDDAFDLQGKILKYGQTGLAKAEPQSGCRNVGANIL